MKYAIIADIAGQFEALMRLVDKIPKDYEIILLGDLIDRGPDSRLVVQWAIDNNIKCCYANHEDMMVHGFIDENYSYRHMWIGNSGHATLRSYEGHKEVALKHIEWMKNNPRVIHLKVKVGCFEEVVCTHAPIHSKYLYELSDRELADDVVDHFNIESSVIWNRRPPIRRQYLQVSGHNSHWGLKTFKDDKQVWAYSLDQSKDYKLTALLLPSETIVEESYDIPVKKKYEVKDGTI